MYSLPRSSDRFARHLKSSASFARFNVMDSNTENLDFKLNGKESNKNRFKLAKYRCSTIATTSSFDSDYSEDTLTTTSDIFYIYNPEECYQQEKDQGLVKNSENEPKSVRKRSTSKFDNPIPGTYVKHANLDVELTICQRVRLLSMHYLRLKNLLRLSFIVFCLCWFVYNSYIVLKQYLYFDTIVYMEYQSPKSTGLPSITFCTYCIYCSYNDELYDTIYVDDLMQDDPDVFYHDLEQEVNQSMESSEVKVKKRVVRFKDVIKNCFFITSTVTYGNEDRSKSLVFSCTEIAPVVTSMQEGRKCFTFFSDMNGQMSQKNSSMKRYFSMEFERYPKIQIEFEGTFLTGSPTSRYASLRNNFDNSTDHKKQSNQYSTNGLFLSIHSPTILPNMLDLSFHQVLSGKSTRVKFVKKTENLKPWPYRTNCFDYNSNMPDWPEDNDWSILYSGDALTRSGLKHYRSRGECFVYCMWRLMNSRQCVNYFSIFTKSLFDKQTQVLRSMYRYGYNSSMKSEKKRIPFCRIRTSSNGEYMFYRKKCSESCNKACKIDTFFVESISDVEYIDTSESLVSIEWAIEPSIYIQHQAKITLPGILGNIGGHAHIWLGISVIHLFGYLVKLIRTGKCLSKMTKCLCVCKWRTSKKGHCSQGQF